MSLLPWPQVARDKLVSLGTPIGKLTHSGKFRLTVGALDVLSRYAKHKVSDADMTCVSLIQQMQFAFSTSHMPSVFSWYISGAGGGLRWATSGTHMVLVLVVMMLCLCVLMFLGVTLAGPRTTNHMRLIPEGATIFSSFH